MSERPMFHLTWEQYETVIRAAFEEGYVQGFYHPKGISLIVKSKEISAAFWKRVRSGIESGRKSA